ncbi:hypothetical protein C8Q77DRAFT_1070932 [Trametes polyzona]|nr:hypothetical protein C8Q77DRAFT_1070932 [Trametes polyzona]
MHSSSGDLHNAYQYKSSPHSFQPFLYPCDRQFPIYAHCNSQRNRKTPRLHCNTSQTITLRPNKDLMVGGIPVRRKSRSEYEPEGRCPCQQTVDYRYLDTERQPRSSFALSDIFETDEEDVEIEISPVLPSTPNTASSVSTSKSAKARVRALFMGVAYSVKASWSRARSARK